MPAYYPDVIPTLASPADDPNGIGDAASKVNGTLHRPRHKSFYADEVRAVLYNLRGIAVALGMPTGSGSAFAQIATLTAQATAGFANNAVTNAKLRDSAAVSVIGRSGNTIGDPADIAAAANDRLLARVGDALAFVQLTAGMIPDGLITAAKLVAASIGTTQLADGAVTDAKLRDSAAVSVVGRSANTLGDPADIAAGANDRLLARVADALAFVQLTAGMIPDGLVTNAKLRDSAAVSVLGRSAGTAGVPADIAAGANDRLLARVGDALAFVQLTLGMIPDGLITATKLVAASIGTTQLTDGAVTDAKLRDSAATSVIGRSAGSSGDPADIAASSDDTFLRRVSGALSWGGLTLGMIADGLVTRAKLANGAALSVVGRSANSSGVLADIAATTNDRVLARTSSAALDWVQVTSAMLASSIVTPPKLAAWPAASIQRIGAQSIPSGALTLVQLDSSTFSATGGVGEAPTVNTSSTYRITIVRAGLYRVSARANITPSANGFFGGSICLNGAEASQAGVSAVSGVPTTVHATELMSLAVNDYLDLRIYHTVGSNQNTGTGHLRPILQAEYVGPIA